MVCASTETSQLIQKQRLTVSDSHYSYYSCITFIKLDNVITLDAPSVYECLSSHQAQSTATYVNAWQNQ